MTRTLATVLVCTLALAAVVFAFAKPGRAHDPYSTWHPPGNPKTSCCNGQDCRPTRAYMGEDGLWRAWSGSRWLTVPADRVLPTDLAGDGRNHLCASVDDHVFCFSPTLPKG